MEKVVVQSMPDYSYALLISDGRHGLVADEPEAEGGDGLGPNPYELLLAALGACTAMTLTMYARRKAWPLEEISVHLSHERRFPDDCKDCGNDHSQITPGTKIEVIRRDISVRGDLTNEQVQRLQEIADRCPVHRTLQAAPRVITSILAGA